MGDRFRRKVALVTGEDHDLIKEMSTLLASEGAAVVANCSHREWVDGVVSEIIAFDGVAKAGHFDLTSMREAESLLNFTLDSFGKVDLLVSGIAIRDAAPGLDSMPEKWDEIIRPAIKNVFAITKYVSAYMRAQNGGQIVNIIKDKKTNHDISLTHSVITEAIIGFTRTAALDMEKYGVGCNAIISDHPRNSALVAAYICANLVTSGSSSIFRVDEQEVSLYSVPAIERGIYSSDVFSVEELNNLVPKYLFDEDEFN